MDARDVDEWLHRAVSWLENKDIECLVDQQHRLTELVAFLQQLQVEFTQLVRLCAVAIVSASSVSF